MSDKQDSNNEIQSISQKFETVTTIESSTDERTKVYGTNSSIFQQNNNKSHQIHEHLTERNLPELNLPEKILFVIDTTREPQWTQFVFNTGAKYSPLEMMKKVIEMFVISKSGFQRKHEFAIMTLNTNSCNWICDFTNNIKTILSNLNNIVEDVQEESPEEQENNCKTYDLGQLFENIHNHITLPNVYNDVPPTFVSRVILFYSRSNCIPLFHTGQQYFNELVKNPYFFLDSLYVHEVPNKDNMCEQIYKEINLLDVRGLSYILEVGRICREIYNNIAKLTAHPLQRPLQKDACYVINPTSSKHEIHTNV